MATRLERHIKHRQRALRRAARYRLNFWHQPGDAMHPANHGGGKPWVPKVVRPFAPLVLKTKPHTAGGWIYLPDHAAGYDLTKPGRGRPPHARFTDPFLRNQQDHHGHLPLEIIGFHQRMPLYRGHKKDRMNGAARKLYGALFFAVQNGYFPPWDPAGRHPTQADVASGSPPYSADWRWGVTGVYPP